jgi:uncharacterized delta-60 repeat protein
MKKPNLVRTMILAGSLLLQQSTLCFHSRGAFGDVDWVFFPDSGVPVSSLVIQSDGKVLVGGALTFVNGTNRYASARLNADGTLDATFVQGTFNPDWAAVQTNDCTPEYPSCSTSTEPASLVVQSDGNVLIGGSSLTVGCNEANCNYTQRYLLARFKANGSADTSFHPAVGNQLPLYGDIESVRALAVQPDGKIVIGLGAVKEEILRFARLNTDGTFDSTFNAGANNSSSIHAIALQSDGKILIGGELTFGNFTNRNNIARLNADGSLDDGFHPGAGPNSTVRCIAVQPDGKVLIGGSFTHVNGATRNGIARLNANGTLDASFNPGSGVNGGVNSSVFSMALQPDGNILIGGYFLGEVLRPYVARLYGDSPLPSLSITRSNAFVIVSWPASATSYSLQENTNLSLTNSWPPVAQLPATNAGRISVTVPAAAGSKFFRLSLP